MTSKPKDENKDAYEEAVQIGQELAGRLQTHDMSEVMNTELQAVRFDHCNNVWVGGIDHPATDAFFTGYYAPGIILSSVSMSPQYMISLKNLEGPPPELGHWSDVSALQYKQFFPIDQLESVVRMNVTNDKASNVCDEIKKREGIKGEMKHPGKRYHPGQPHFNALLGTPNGRGVAYLLLQHGKHLGLQKAYVFEIQMWDSEDRSAWIWFKIRSADEGNNND